MLFAVLLVGLTTFGQENSVVYKHGWNTKNSSETIGIWEGKSNKSWTGFIPVMGINANNEVRMYFQNKIYKTNAVKRNKKGTKFIIMMVDDLGSIAEMTMTKEKDSKFYRIEFMKVNEDPIAFYVKRENNETQK